MNVLFNQKLEELRSILETSENEWREKIIAALKAGYESDGLDGLKMSVC